MIITKVEIEKFRGFEKVEFDLGSQLTIIAGQNGTQKTTILGMLSQPFTITDEANPMIEEMPLSGGSFKSAFSEKFKLSNRFDKVKMHEWTLHLANDPNGITIESIPRDKNSIRFWPKGSREKGSGYIQLPVIYLSLKRLIPIGEDSKLNESSKFTLSDSEIKFYKEWHKKILITLDDYTEASYLESSNKNTIGVSTDHYDWRQNSAGQDNIGKILLAIMSFRRLDEKYPSNYQGGILAIDELDATLYPASQIKLVDALRKFASNYKIQILFTTHSLSVLEHVCLLRDNLQKVTATKNQINVVYLEKKNGKIKPINNASIYTIKHRLEVSVSEIHENKIEVFSEDRETAIFAKALLKKRTAKLHFIDCNLGCDNLVDLATHKIPSFIFPKSIVILDGDVRDDSKKMAKSKRFRNFIVLPNNLSPERLLADFLYNLDDESNVWAKINPNFTKQYCFKDYTPDEIRTDREKAKKWFNSQLKLWGRNATKVINPWISENKEIVDIFIKEFEVVYNKFAKAYSIEGL